MQYKYKRSADVKNLNVILEKLERLHHIKDIQSLLESILIEARDFSNADAGSIFLVEDNKLKFSYVQNDTLFKSDLLSNKYIYSNREISINDKSIAGYVALKGESLAIDDAYKLDKSLPYSFNSYFDQISSYRTTSLLVVPLKNSKGAVVGVLELINAKNENNEVKPFSTNHRLFTIQFSHYISIAIEKAVMIRDIVLRMVKLAELRDPEETQAHVNRVGSYAIEIYQKWAENHSVPKTEINGFKDALRIAAMLHDVGKVGIPDSILKKKEKLNEEEFDFIKLHTIYGAQLFENSHSDWEMMASEIILNHHEKWDGSGYFGKCADISCERPKPGKGKKGGEIPLSARIVALADVYDALITKRVYKDAWEEDKVLYHLKEQSGKHFDPELVEIFFDIYETVKAIRLKYVNP
jgi:HD-GYP domain-containing protein (c-di-GMP phosphodiesterase class II)